MAFLASMPAPFRLSNQQWKGIKAAGLPDAARAEIEWAIATFKHELAFRGDHRPIPKRQLLRVAELADQLLTMVIGNNINTRAKLRRMYEPNFWSGETATADVLNLAGRIYSHQHKFLVQLAGGLQREAFASRAEAKGEEGLAWPPSPLPKVYVDDNAIQLLYQCCWHIEQLRFSAEKLARIRRKRKGVRLRVQSHRTFVSKLDDIFIRHIGKLINRSYKQADLRRCIELCFRAVDSNFGSGSIDKAIQAHVSERKRARKWLDQWSVGTTSMLPLSELLHLANHEMARRSSKSSRVTKLRN